MPKRITKENAAERQELAEIMKAGLKETPLTTFDHIVNAILDSVMDDSYQRQ